MKVYGEINILTIWIIPKAQLSWEREGRIEKKRKNGLRKRVLVNFSLYIEPRLLRKAFSWARAFLRNIEFSFWIKLLSHLRKSFPIQLFILKKWFKILKQKICLQSLTAQTKMNFFERLFFQKSISRETRRMFFFFRKWWFRSRWLFYPAVKISFIEIISYQ